MLPADKKSCLRVAVIGGGASGLFCAVTLAQKAKAAAKSVCVTIYEANTRVGKKILVTGNGRCNLTNQSISVSDYTGNLPLFNSVYNRFSNTDAVNFFKSCGMLTKSDFAGRVYPLSNQASSVLDVLRSAAQRLSVNTVTDEKVNEIAFFSGEYVINGKYKADKIVIACGGSAAPVHGSDGSGFELLNKLNVKTTTVYPALTPLVVNNFTKALKGIRAEGKIQIKLNGSILAEAKGELQYTDFGISGIPAMQVSYAASRCFYENIVGTVTAVIDSAPSVSEEELFLFIKNITENNPLMSAETVLGGIMPKRLGTFLLSECSINPSKPLFPVHEAVVSKIVAAVKSKKYKLSGVKGFNDAQVSAGGIDANEISPETLELIKHKGIFVCGEMLGVTGTCGGYNLQWAWSSAYVAAVSLVEEI